MTTTHTQPAGCDLDSLEALLNAATPEDWVIGETYADMYDDGPGAPETVIRGLGGEAGVAVALDFGSNNPSWREANAAFIVAAKNAMPALIAAARAAQAPQVAQHAETIEQYVPPQAEILADEAKLYRDLTGDAMALGFDGVPAALEALRTVRSQAPQGDTRQGAAIALPVDLIHDFRDAIAVARHRAKHDGDTASKKRWIEVASRLDGYARSIATPAVIENSK